MDARNYYGDLIHHRMAGPFVFTESLFQGGPALPTHAHPSPYITFTLTGSYRERYGARWRTCSPGTGVGHPAHEPHSQFFDREPAVLLRLSPAADAEGAFAHFAFGRPAAFASAPIARAFEQLHQELQRADDFTGMILEGLAYEIAARTEHGALTGGGSRKRALRALALLRVSLRRPPSIGAMARELDVSRATLYRDFKSALGCSPGEYLRRARIGMAVEALRKNVSIVDIALECGFYDQSHFNRCFRLAMGCSPSQFRSRAI